MKRIVGPMIVCLFSGTGCGDDVRDNDPKPVVIDESMLEDQVAIQLQPGMAVNAASSDGKLRITVPPDAVSEAVELTVARLSASAKPGNVSGEVYVLGPSGLAFNVPVRLRFLLDGPSKPQALRPVQIDTADGRYAVLDDWVYVAGDDAHPHWWAGNIIHLSAYAVSDGAGSGFTNDSGPGDLTRVAAELLAEHQIVAARDSYLAAVSANPENLQAHMGAALTRLAMLPEHSAVDDVLTLCGEPPIDWQNQMFGNQGFIAWTQAHRQGTTTVTVEIGSTIAGLSPIEFRPNSITAEREQWEEQDQPRLRLRAEDIHSPEIDSSVKIALGMDNLDDASWVDDAVFSMPPQGGPFWLDFWMSSLDNEDDQWLRLVSGTLKVHKAGKVAGDAIEIELVDIVYEQVDQAMSVSRVIRLNGRLADVISANFEPAQGSLPFQGLEYIPADPNSLPPTPAKSEVVTALEKCGVGLNEAFVKGKLDSLADELIAIRGHLDTLANSDSVNTFVWELPAGAAANGAAIPVGPVEVHALRTALFLFEGANELVQAYSWVGPNTAPMQLMGDYDRYDCEWLCPEFDPCGDSCTTEFVHDIDMQLLANVLNSNFLAPVAGVSFGPATLEPAEAALQNALAAAISALNAQPGTDVLLNFRSPAATAAADELVSFLTLLGNSLTSDQPVPVTPEWILFPHKYFASPFTRASLLAALEAGSKLWNYLPADAATYTNAGVEPNTDALAEMLKLFMELPQHPETTIYCTSDAECQEGDRPDYWTCSGWPDGPGVCSGDDSVSCWDESTCTGSGIGTCVRSTCEAREPHFFDAQVVEQAFDADPPGFVNRTLWEAIAQGL